MRLKYHFLDNTYIKHLDAQHQKILQCSLICKAHCVRLKNCLFFFSMIALGILKSHETKIGSKYQMHIYTGNTEREERPNQT